MLYRNESYTRKGKRKDFFMSEYKPCMLRLRVETHQMLRDAVEKSSHRSMSALADEILHVALARLSETQEAHSGIDRMIKAANK
jgi:hypothetical protein